MTTASVPSGLLTRPPDQISLVVADLEASARLLSDVLRVGPWRGWTYTADYIPMRTYRGERGQFVSKCVTCSAGPQLEVIEPLQGPSIFNEFLDEHGPGLHHVGYFVASFETATQGFAAQGLNEIQGGGGHGVDGDGRYGFFDPGGPTHLLIEVIEPPRRRRDPHFVLDTSCSRAPAPEHQDSATANAKSTAPPLDQAGWA